MSLTSPGRQPGLDPAASVSAAGDLLDIDWLRDYAVLDGERLALLWAAIDALRGENSNLVALLRAWYETQDAPSSARRSAAQLDTGRLLRGDPRWAVALPDDCGAQPPQARP